MKTDQNQTLTGHSVCTTVTRMSETSEHNAAEHTGNIVSASAVVTLDGNVDGNVSGNTVVPEKVGSRTDLRGLKAPADLSQSIHQGPVQPKLHRFPPSNFGNQNRCFSASYYTKFPFVEYSVDRDAVFCFYCRVFPSSASELTFTCEGFNKWKDIGESLHKHAKSGSHATCMEAKFYF